MINTGNVKTKRIKIKTYREAFTIPSGYSNMLVQNHGSYRARISFKGDDNTDYFGLDPHEKLPVLTVIGGLTVMYHVAEASETEIEILLWG